VKDRVQEEVVDRDAVWGAVPKPPGPVAIAYAQTAARRSPTRQEYLAMKKNAQTVVRR
jgi:hypothetical protein